ncbi:response regulator [Pedobacter hiemivivus]|uniref:histidine kinase n=2 Tax=Pedobacter hiemivivus TaxID=2530454 RepID=A0A4U1FZM5_9SPHI|nr:response regulator [Pedobacter hiemivivus]
MFWFFCLANISSKKDFIRLLELNSRNILYIQLHNLIVMCLLRVILFTLIIFGWTPLSQAQINCKVTRYTSEDGLSHDRTNVIVQDQDGYIWIGGWGGINRFDGRNFSSFKYGPGDIAAAVRTSRIERIIDDGEGNLWLKGLDKRIYCFVKKSEKFSSLKELNLGESNIQATEIYYLRPGLVGITMRGMGGYIISTKHDKLRAVPFNTKAKAGGKIGSDSVRFIFSDQHNQIWLGTHRGVYGVKTNENGRYGRIRLTNQLLSSLNFTSFSEDESSIYLATLSGHLVTINKISHNVLVKKITTDAIVGLKKSKKNALLFCTTNKGSLLTVNDKAELVNDTRIDEKINASTIFEDRSGNLWIESSKRGVIRYVPGTGKFNWFQNRADGINNGLQKYNIFEDDLGRIWVNMKGGGFGYFDEPKMVISGAYLAEGESVNGMFPDMVNNCLYDRFGVIWLATHKGIVEITPPNSDFSPQLVTENSNRLANQVRGITTDHFGRTWMGTKKGRIFLYKNGGLQPNPIENLPKNGLGSIYAILEDHKGTIWIGTKGQGLFKADPISTEGTSYRLSHFEHNPSDKNSLGSNKIVALFEDQSNRVWLGTFERGLDLATEENGITAFVHVGQHMKETAEFCKIRSITADADHNLWVGTTNGLMILRPNGISDVPQKVKFYVNKETDPNSLGANDVQHIFYDGKEEMWLSTSGGGLCKANYADPLKSIKFKNYNSTAGLLSNYVLSAQQDKNGKIWLATQTGLSRFDPTKGTFRNYREEDGVFVATFSEGTVTASPNGEITFGTEKGFLKFDPLNLNEKQRSSRIIFHNLLINNQSVNVGDVGSVLQVGIDKVDKLQLKYDQNTISIGFGMLDFRDGLKRQLLYRLKGFDNNWHFSGNQHRATYTNLPPGEYIFEVKNLKNDYYLNETTKELEINVQPPFWRTWWAYLFYAILLSGAIIVIFRIIRTILRLRQSVAIEREVAALKVDFFTQVSHELRTPLTLILNPIKAIMETEQLSVKGSQYIQMIHRNAGRLTRFMDQWLDLRKIQSGKGELHYQIVELIGFIRKFPDYFKGADTEKNISFAIQCEFDELYVQIDPEKVDVMVYNLLANAYKFSNEGGLIEIFIKVDNHHNFSIAISDRGIGLPPDQLEEVFVLYHIDNRKETNAIKGIGIGLALVKEIAELHNGTVAANNNEHGGLTVEVILPLKGNVLENVTNDIGWKAQETAVPAADLNSLYTEELMTDSSLYPVLLLVEDSYELRAFLTKELGANFTVICENDGLAGFTTATKILPDLILSDVMMPVMDGIEMLDKLKNDQRTSHIPIVLLSARASIESKLEGLRYGADHYFTKPFNKEMLITAMQSLIKQRRKMFSQIKDKVVDLLPGQVVITSKDEIFLKNVIKIVEENMANPDFTIEALADQVAMGRTAFYSKFRSLAGVTAVDFVRDMRLARAKQLFDAGEERISMVAFEVGFNNPKYFSTCFKEKYNTSPTQYVKHLTHS